MDLKFHEQQFYFLEFPQVGNMNLDLTASSNMSKPVKPCLHIPTVYAKEVVNKKVCQLRSDAFPIVGYPFQTETLQTHCLCFALPNLLITSKLQQWNFRANSTWNFSAKSAFPDPRCWERSSGVAITGKQSQPRWQAAAKKRLWWVGGCGYWLVVGWLMVKLRGDTSQQYRCWIWIFSPPRTQCHWPLTT